ncbi:hypothetical protein F4680DRAFT_450671 [Xylaria scruposa]|nr:hypothetical protein F4680DRAFT_450671 [Xylaria scruposa]
MEFITPRDPDVDRGLIIIGICSAECAVSLVLLILRLWARSKISATGWDDIFVIITWVLFPVLTVLVGLLGSAGETRHLYYLSKEVAKFVTKLNRISQAFAIIALSTGKLADTAALWGTDVRAITNYWDPKIQSNFSNFNGSAALNPLASERFSLAFQLIPATSTNTNTDAPPPRDITPPLLRTGVRPLPKSPSSQNVVAAAKNTCLAIRPHELGYPAPTSRSSKKAFSLRLPGRFLFSAHSAAAAYRDYIVDVRLPPIY